MSVTVSGVAEYAAAMDAYRVKVGHQVDLVVIKVSSDIEAWQKAHAAVDTGFMRNGIGTDRSGSCVGGGTIITITGPTASYSVYVEGGTSRMAPQPFVGPSIDANSAGFYAALQAVIGTAI